MVQCAGCYRNFSASGYTSHVTRTLNEVCRAVYRNTLRHEDFNDELDGIDPDDFEGKFSAGGESFHT